jgi:DNA-binding response OmpR family regulator
MERLHVLVVEDDDAIARGLAAALEREGYSVEVAPNAATALDCLRLHDVSLVILDLALPDGDGVDLCRQVRSEGCTAPIIMLTARREEADFVVGLDAGANDYIAKPFRLAELLARVRAQLRAVQGVEDPSSASSGRVEYGDISVDILARRAYVAGAELDLRPKEFDLLAVLVSHAGNALTRERIMELVWDEHWFGSTKTLDMHVSSLRKKLGPEGTRIATLRHVGYRFDP